MSQDNNNAYDRTILELLAKEMLRRLSDPDVAATMSAAELEVARKLSGDAGITLATIRNGDYGDAIKRTLGDVEGDFMKQLPFDVDDMPQMN